MAKKKKGKKKSGAMVPGAAKDPAGAKRPARGKGKPMGGRGC